MESTARDREVSRITPEIYLGYSKFKWKSSTAYLKHFSPIDNIDVEELRQNKIAEALSSGLISEKEQAGILAKDGLWSQNDDDDVFQLKYYIDNLKNTRSLLAIPSQIRQQDALIKDEEVKLNKVYERKAELFGLTAEKWAERQTSNSYVYFSLFKDRKLDEPLFDEEEFQVLDMEEINEVVSLYNNIVNPFSEDNIKYIALSNGFQNALSFSDNPYYLFGKPIVNITFFQSSLVSYAKFYKFILSEMTNLPADIKSDPVKLENSFTASRNLNKTLGGKANEEVVGVGSEMVSVFGATQEDLKEMGLASNNTGEGQLHAQLKEKGEMSFMDILKLPEFRN